MFTTFSEYRKFAVNRQLYLDSIERGRGGLVVDVRVSLLSCILDVNENGWQDAEESWGLVR